MQLPKLTPLQSRFAASFTASLILFVLYLTFSNPHFAYATDTDSIAHHDHNHPPEFQHDPQGKPELDGREEESNIKLPKYQPDFPAGERGINGRAPTAAVKTLVDNVPGVDSIAPGETHYWVFPASALSAAPSSPTPALPSSQVLFDTSAISDSNGPESARQELKRRQPGDIWLYTTLSVCQQPSAIERTPEGPPNPITLYTSQSAGNQYPGPNVNQLQTTHTAVAGFVNYTDLTSGDSYFGVYAPDNPGFSGKFTYQLTSSIEAPYTYYYDSQGLYLMDSDRNSSLLVSSNLTTPNSSVQDWMRTGGPFDIFIHDQKDVAIKGLLNSYCGLNNTAQIRGRTTVDVGMTTLGGGPAMQQFYVSGLNKSTTYYAVMGLKSKYAQVGPSHPGGGGMTWQSITFTTKSG